MYLIHRSFCYNQQDKKKVEEFKKLAEYVQGAYDEDEAFQVGCTSNRLMSFEAHTVYPATQKLEKDLQETADKEMDGKAHRVYYVSVYASGQTWATRLMSPVCNFAHTACCASFSVHFIGPHVGQEQQTQRWRQVKGPLKPSRH